jgi:hypothetical protein
MILLQQIPALCKSIFIPEAFLRRSERTVSSFNEKNPAPDDFRSFRGGFFLHLSAAFSLFFLFILKSLAVILSGKIHKIPEKGRKTGTAKRNAFPVGYSFGNDANATRGL